MTEFQDDDLWERIHQKDMRDCVEQLHQSVKSRLSENEDEDECVK